jgi:hypothetical protein
MNMTVYDITLQELLSYFLAPNVANRMIELLQDNDDIFKNHYAIYLNDQRYMADLLTVIKLKMQAVTQEMYMVKVNNTEGNV